MLTVLAVHVLLVIVITQVALLQALGIVIHNLNVLVQEAIGARHGVHHLLVLAEILEHLALLELLQLAVQDIILIVTHKQSVLM